jgi:hypothetical protein
MFNMNHSRLRHLALVGLTAFILVGVGGCEWIGWAADPLSPKTTVEAAYKGLPDQKCAVMVWVDGRILSDYRLLQLDTSKGIATKIKEATAAQVKEVQNITWVEPEQVVQFQQEHPELELQSAESIAPLLGVTRLIYVEVENFTIHPNDSPDLWRGDMSATLEVIEVANGKGKVVYTEHGIENIFPEKCPVEGMPDQNDDTVYHNTIDGFTTEIVKRFIPYQAEDDDDDL